MGTRNFSDDLKRDAVAPITERGCPLVQRLLHFLRLLAIEAACYPSRNIIRIA